MEKLPSHTLRKKPAGLYRDMDISPADLEKLLHGDIDRIGHIDRVHLYRRLLMTYDRYTRLSIIPPERLCEALSEPVLENLQPATGLQARYRYARTLLFELDNKNQMIWTLQVKLPGRQSECVRVIEIKSAATFLALHEAIQAAVDFDNDHLYEFFIGRHPGNRAYTIGGEPDWDTINPDRTYRKVRLSDVWPLPTGMKLYYLFDFGDNWLFQINKTRHKDKPILPGIVYPRVIEAKGRNPEQYPDWEDWEE